MAKRKFKPFHHVILKLDKPFSETIKAGNLELYLDPTFNPEQHVAVTGVVVGMPTKNPFGDSLKEGDTVCFSYSVVAEREFDDEPHNFHAYVNEENLQIFYNRLNEKLQVRAVEGTITKRFICTFHDRFGDFQHGFDGTFHEKERWLSQFKYGDVQQFKFKNTIDVDGEIYWKCEFQDIFAKKVGKKLHSVSNRLILNPIKLHLKPEDFEKNGLAVPKSSIRLISRDVAKVESAPADVPLQKGNKVGFDGQFTEKYTFFGKEYFLLNSERILGVWN